MRLKPFLLFVTCILGLVPNYAGTKKVVDGIYFDGAIDYEKMPHGEGTLHIFGFYVDNRKGTAVANKKNEILTIKGVFEQDKIKNAEIRSGKCVITGTLSYKISKKAHHIRGTQNVVTLKFVSVKFEDDNYKSPEHVSFDKPVTIGASEDTSTEEKTAFLADKYEDSSIFEEMAEFFETSITSYLWNLSLTYYRQKFSITRTPSTTVRLENKALLGLIVDDGYIYNAQYLSPDGDDIMFKHHQLGLGKIELSKAHIVSDYNVVYDGEWNGYVGYNNFRIKIKYPDGTLFDGETETEFLSKYNNFVGLNIYKILNSSDANFLQPYEGTLTKANGEQETINKGEN